MLFASLVLATAFFIEGIGTYISILGLSSLFAGSIVVTMMAVALDIGKVVAVSFAYKNWANIGWLMKLYMAVAIAILMAITSAGVFGYLSGEFQKAMSSNSQQNVLITALADEQTRLQKRKEQIDGQIAAIPDKFSAGQRTRMINQFKAEQQQVTNRLTEIDKQLPQLKINNIGQSVKIGPIIYVAEAFNTTPEQAVKWVILTIIFVFDPLAVVLLIAGNSLLSKRETAPLEEKQQASLIINPIEVQPLAASEVNNSEPEIAEVLVPPAPENTVSTNSVTAVKKRKERKPKTGQPVEPKKVNEPQSLSPVVAPPARSSLEDIDSAKGDVSIDGNLTSSSKSLRGVYAEKQADTAVMVGGPSGKKR